MGPNFDRREALAPYMNLKLRLGTIERMDSILESMHAVPPNPDVLTVLMNRGYYLDMPGTNQLIRYNADIIIEWLDDASDTEAAQLDPRAGAFKEGCGVTYACFMMQFGPHIPQLSIEASRAGGLALEDIVGGRDGRKQLPGAISSVIRNGTEHLEQDTLLHDYLEGLVSGSPKHWAQKYYFMAGAGFIGYSLAVAEAYPRMITGQLPGSAEEISPDELSLEVEKFLKDVQDDL